MAETPQLDVAEKPDKRRMSRGEKLFSTIVYGPVAFTAAFVLSAILATLQKRKAPAITDWMVDWFKKIKMPDSIAEASAPVILTSWGGTLAVVPIKWMEDRKVVIVNRFNRWFGEKTQSEDSIVAPKQSWGSLILGRLAVIFSVWPVMSIVGGLIGPQMGKGEHATGAWVAKRFGVPTHRNLPPELPARAAELGKQIEALGKHAAKDVLGPLKKELTDVTRLIDKHETVHYTVGRMLAVDAIVTAVAVVVLYFTSHFFASLKKQKPAAEEKAEQKKEAQIVTNMPPATDKKHTDKMPAASFAAKLAEQQLATDTPTRGA